MSAYCKLFASLSFVLLGGAVTWAEENTVAEKPGESVATEQPGVAHSPTTEQVAEWVQQLDADDFVVRETAVKELTAVGPVVASRAVAEAARSDSLEASTRAFAILEKWLGLPDPGQQNAAREALAKLAMGEESSSSARRAKAVLNKTRQTASQASPAFGRFPAEALPVVGLGVARMELRAMAAVADGVKGRRMSVSIGQGTKTTKVSEGNLEVEIVETDKDGIKIKVVEKGADKAVAVADAKAALQDKEKKVDQQDKEKESPRDKITEYAAKTFDELKEKQPEGFKVYEKYAGAMNGLKIKMEAAAPALVIPAPVEAEKLTEEQKKEMLAKKAAELERRRAELLKARNAEVLKEVEETRRQKATPPQTLPAE